MVARFDALNRSAQYSLKILAPQYTESGEGYRLLSAGDITTLVEPTFPERFITEPLLHTGLEIPDGFDKTNCTFTLNTFIPEVIRQLYLDNIRSTIGPNTTTSGAPGRTAANTQRTTDALLPTLIFREQFVHGEDPALTSTYRLDHGREVVMEGRFVNVTRTHTRGSVATLECEFNPHRLFGEATGVYEETTDTYKRVSASNKFQADRYISYDYQEVFVDGIDVLGARDAALAGLTS